MTDKDILGLPPKTWAIIILSTFLGMSVIFVILPFLLSVILPIVSPDNFKDYKYLVDMLDGVAIVVGIVGTVASIVSILMTLADKKRYNLEKKQTEDLVSSVNELHKEIREVDSCVKQTFEHNQKLSLELYKKSIIDVNLVAKTSVGVATDNHSKNWETKASAGEKENDQ